MKSFYDLFNSFKKMAISPSPEEKDAILKNDLNFYARYYEKRSAFFPTKAIAKSDSCQNEIKKIPLKRPHTR